MHDFFNGHFIMLQNTDELLADTADELQDASVEFRNVLNRFTLLGNSQFMENVRCRYCQPLFQTLLYLFSVN